MRKEDWKGVKMSENASFFLIFRAGGEMVMESSSGPASVGLSTLRGALQNEQELVIAS